MALTSEAPNLEILRLISIKYLKTFHNKRVWLNLKINSPLLFRRQYFSRFIFEKYGLLKYIYTKTNSIFLAFNISLLEIFSGDQNKKLLPPFDLHLSNSLSNSAGLSIRRIDPLDGSIWNILGCSTFAWAETLTNEIYFSGVTQTFLMNKEWNVYRVFLGPKFQSQLVFFLVWHCYCFLLNFFRRGFEI